MLKRGFRLIWRYVLLFGVLGVFVATVSNLITGVHARDRIFEPEEAPEERVAIVFGAGLRRDGTPTAMLRDRVLTGADLYFSGKVDKLLMSGDNRFIEYNEPEAMRQFALSVGVPDEAIVLDYAGRRTYDTCYRAKVIFGLDTALLVTQRFHLPRALYLCDMLGMETLGVDAENCYWTGSPFFWNVREFLATVAAFLDLYVRSPSPVLGSPEPIFVD